MQGLVLTKLDVLDGLPELQICTGYEINGKRYGHLPAGQAAQAAAKPVYERSRAGRTAPAAPAAGRSSPRRPSNTSAGSRSWWKRR